MPLLILSLAHGFLFPVCAAVTGVVDLVLALVRLLMMGQLRRIRLLSFPKGVLSRGTWVGMKSHGRGGTFSFRTSCFHFYNTNKIPMEDLMVLMHQAVEISGSLPPRNSNPAAISDKGDPLSEIEQVPRPSTVSKLTLDTGKPVTLVSLDPTPPIMGTGSPPPVIRSFILSSSNLDLSLSENPHSMVVDRDLSALGGDHSDESDIGDEDDSGESDDAISNDDGPDDSMTLIKYQDKSRRETLVRKGLHVTGSSRKKGILEIGEPNS